MRINEQFRRIQIPELTHGYEKIGKVFGLDIYQSAGRLPFDIGFKNNGITVDEGGSQPINDGGVVYSHGSVECASILIGGILIKPKLLHSLGSTLTGEQEQDISTTSQGIVLGGSSTKLDTTLLERYSDLFSGGFLIIQPQSGGEKQGMITVVGKKAHVSIVGVNYPSGIYVSYAPLDLFPI